MNPRVLNIDIEIDYDGDHRYSMEVDIRKADCSNREAAHWHLCENGRRIGQITVPRCVWTELPADCPRAVIIQAEKLTKQYRDEIESVYNFNRINGLS